MASSRTSLRTASVTLLLLAAANPAATAGPPPQRLHEGVVAAQRASLVPLELAMVRGYPQVVAGRFNVPGSTPGAKARAYVNGLAKLYGQNFDSRLRTRVTRATSGGAVVGQTYRGVPVYGARLSVFASTTQVFGSVGRLATEVSLDPRPTLTAAAAEDKLRAALTRPRARVIGDTSVVIFVPDLVGRSGRPRPAFRVVIDGAPPIGALVDGISGEVLLQEPLEYAAYQMALYDVTNRSTGGCFGDVTGLPLAATQAGVHSDYRDDSDVAISKTAVDNAYALFKDQLGRLSYDGGDAKLNGYVHLSAANAYWSPACNEMKVGNGVVTNDVWLHELAHGVTQYTSGLIYEGQSGALSESFSDVMAAASDADRAIDGGSLGVIRDMANPAAKGQPGHMLDFVVTAGDHGGVHTNSGIPNKARQLMADGGEWPGAPRPTFTVTGFGRAKMAKVAYAGNVALGPNADFDDAAGAEIVTTEVAAALSSGFTAADVCTVRNAWAAVGVAIALADRDCNGTADGNEADADGDGVTDAADNCPTLASQDLSDTDGDGLGNPCDGDRDGDGIKNESDNCAKPNADQKDENGNGTGDACEDTDDDGVRDEVDNCPTVANASQADADGDKLGDACEADSDGDGVLDSADNCAFVAGRQTNGDGDALGDACDPCPAGADVVVGYTAGNAQLGTKPRPILRDSDDDGTPDGCEKVSKSPLVAVSGDRVRRAIAIRPGATRALLVRGPKGTRFRVVVPPCAAKACGALLDRGGLAQVLVAGLGPHVRVRLVDDLGTTAAASSARTRGGLVLRFRPRADRRYFLEGLTTARLPRAGDRFGVKVSSRP